MRILCCFGISTLILVLSPSIATAAEPGWYIAVDAGKTTFSNDAKPDAWLYTGLGTGGPNSSLTHNDDSTGRRFAGGYYFDPYWGLEIGYVDLGEITSDVNIVANPNLGSCGPPCEDSYDLTPRLKAHAWTAEVTGNLPLGTGWALYGRAGYFFWHLDLNDEVTPTNSPPYGNTSIPTPLPISSMSANGWDMIYGLGVRWSFAAHWAARLGWDLYRGMTLNAYYPIDVHMESLGIEYHF